jgi:Protein of unknown function (DUF5661)
MKTNVPMQIVAISTLVFASMSIVYRDNSTPDRRQLQMVEGKFETYRQAIKDAFQIDIKAFKDVLKGGIADGKPIIAYDLEELLTGIKFEMEHTRDGLIALEIAMDHLEVIPDYYSRLRRLEREAKSDKLLDM